MEESESRRKSSNRKPSGKKPNYEKELIRLMLMYGRDMIDYIGSLCNEQQFEDSELREFYQDIRRRERYKQGKEVSVQVYADREHP
ncbi:MAG: hypothetical protein U5K69_26185 [Balneolaceae bacterium]|nr:hypothetical protein [Balneolaceae bacterium]